MCLLTNRNEISKAYQPIRCYKVISFNKEYGFLTPMQKGGITKEMLEGKEVLSAKFERYNPTWNNSEVPQKSDDILQPTSSLYDGRVAQWYLGYKNAVEDGMIHCFVNLEDAKAFMESCKSYFYTNYIWEVEIPEGAQFVEGVFGYSFEEEFTLNRARQIAATSIKFIKELANDKEEEVTVKA